MHELAEIGSVPGERPVPKHNYPPDGAFGLGHLRLAEFVLEQSLLMGSHVQLSADVGVVFLHGLVSLSWLSGLIRVSIV